MRAENRLKLVLAEQETAIRERASQQGEKTTEASVKAALEINPKVREVREELAGAYETQYSLEAGVKALEHRKSELNDLVVLWVKSYYSAPDGGKGLAETREGERNIRKNLNNKGEE